MGKTVAAIWEEQTPHFVFNQLETIMGDQGVLSIVFRADDIGVVDDNYTRLMHLFSAHDLDLCLAVVPQWMTKERWAAMKPFQPERSIWCWHQHGLSHTNHQATGKKAEFGSARTNEAIFQDLAQGKRHLEQILGPLFDPIFTPPWNRCSEATIKALQTLGFSAISRYRDAEPNSMPRLPDLQMNIDLHTRKERNAQLGWTNLLKEFRNGAKSGTLGIMLHHQQMNRNSFYFLERLLLLVQKHDIATATFTKLLKEKLTKS